MAERLNQCPKCGRYQYTDIVVKAHNPDTTDMNMRATLRCSSGDCNHVWEGWTTSPHYDRQRELGWVI